MIPNPDRLVCVEWEDADADAQWHSLDEATERIQRPTIAYTVGWVYMEDDAAIVLTDSLCRDGVGGMHRIPAGMVRGVTRLNGGGPA